MKEITLFVSLATHRRWLKHKVCLLQLYKDSANVGHSSHAWVPYVLYVIFCNSVYVFLFFVLFFLTSVCMGGL